MKNPSSTAPSLSLLNGRGGKPACSGSVFAKFAAPAVLSAALWAHVWIGFLPALALMAVAVAALVFLQKRDVRAGLLSNWASQVSFGERIWLNRLFLPIPQNINYEITTLYLVCWTGALVALLGALTGSILLSASGLSVAFAAQLSCARALVQLYRMMRTDVPLYRFWAATPGNDNKFAAGSSRQSQ